jgi:hypothetical protein
MIGKTEMYKLSKYHNDIVGVVKQEDGYTKSIPFDPDNTDYQAYLAWLEAGNTPTPADEGTQ